MYTVKQVASLTGISEYTLRAWERRYGVVQPDRSSSGYRLYDDAQVARLRAMAALVERGVPASLAAQTLQHEACQPPAPEPGKRFAGDLVAAAASLQPEQLYRLLAEAFSSDSFEAVVDGWLMPQLIRLGAAWRDGELTVAHEHFAASGVMRVLSAFFDDGEPNPANPLVLVGLPAGQRHEIPLLAFAAALRRRGVEVTYLGADVPVEVWAEAAAERLPRGAVIGVHSGGREPAQAVVDRLAALNPPMPVWVGGGSGGEVRGATALPDGIGEAAATLAAQVRSGAS